MSSINNVTSSIILMYSQQLEREDYSSTWETEAEGLGIQGQSGLQSKF